MAEDAVLWQILTAIQSQLKDVSFAPMANDGVRAIAREAIVIRKVKIVERSEERGSREDHVPGIILTPPLQLKMPRTAGTNQRDDVDYPILCQVIDQDNSDPLMGLRTYLKWQQQICREFRNQPLSGITATNTTVYLGAVEAVNVVDEKSWVRHRLFQTGVVLHFLSREPRGNS